MAVLPLLLLVVGSNRAPEHIMSRKMQHHQDPESPKIVNPVRAPQQQEPLLALSIERRGFKKSAESHSGPERAVHARPL